MSFASHRAAMADKRAAVEAEADEVDEGESRAKRSRVEAVREPAADRDAQVTRRLAAPAAAAAADTGADGGTGDAAAAEGGAVEGDKDAATAEGEKDGAEGAEAGPAGEGVGDAAKAADAPVADRCAGRRPKPTKRWQKQ